MSRHGGTLALAAAICALVAADASAATFAVDKTSDDAGGGACTAAAADCSLRSAIMKANGAAGADTITLGAGTFNVAASQQQITEDVTITGAGARSTIIDGGGAAATLFDVNVPGGPVTITDLAVRGAAPGSGGDAVSISGSGPVTLVRLALVDNAAPALVQGGSGLVQLKSSVIARNAGASLGGVANVGSGGLLAISDSTIAQNTGLPADENTALALSGGIANLGIMTITNSTIAGNRVAPTATAVGGDNILDIVAGTTAVGVLRITNSIVADAGNNGNCGGTIQSAGHNLDSDGTCGFVASSDHPGVDPLLLALADNGGPTDTRGIPANSPAVDAGGACAATDQRGVARPAGAACDIGAFESPFTIPVPSPPPPPPPPPAPSADTTAPKLVVSGIAKKVKRKAFNAGLKVKVGANEPIAAELTLLATPRKVTIAKLPSVLASVSLNRAGGTRTVKLKPSEKLKGRRAVKMRLIVVAFDAGGNRASKTVSFTVK
jgi:hypothetical protein